MLQDIHTRFNTTVRIVADDVCSIFLTIVTEYDTTAYQVVNDHCSTGTTRRRRINSASTAAGHRLRGVHRTWCRHSCTALPTARPLPGRQFVRYIVLLLLAHQRGRVSLEELADSE